MGNLQPAEQGLIRPPIQSVHEAKLLYIVYLIFRLLSSPIFLPLSFLVFDHVSRTTLSSKLLTHEKDRFAALAVEAVLRLRGSGNLDYIQIIKKPGGSLKESYLEEG